MWAAVAYLPIRSATLEVAPTFLEVFRANRAYAWRALRYFGVADSDLDDACQEVFLVVHRDLAGFDGEAKLSTWIYAICLRTAATFRRRRARAVARELERAPQASQTDGTPHDALERAEARRTLQAMLDELDDDKRAVFVLHEIEQLPMAEIAGIVSVPLQTGYSRLRAAREQMAAAAKRARARTKNEREGT